MAKQPPFHLIYAPAIKDHLRAVDRKFHSLIRDEIMKHLNYDPGTETRNRKPLTPPGVLEADWELRLGSGNRFRVFYQIDESERIVHILGIGEKDRERLRIGGEELES